MTIQKTSNEIWFVKKITPDTVALNLVTLDPRSVSQPFLVRGTLTNKSCRYLAAPLNG